MIALPTYSGETAIFGLGQFRLQPWRRFLWQRAIKLSPDDGRSAARQSG